MWCDVLPHRGSQGRQTCPRGRCSAYTHLQVVLFNLYCWWAFQHGASNLKETKNADGRTGSPTQPRQTLSFKIYPLRCSLLSFCLLFVFLFPHLCALVWTIFGSFWGYRSLICGDSQCVSTYNKWESRGRHLWQSGGRDTESRHSWRQEICREGPTDLDDETTPRRSKPHSHVYEGVFTTLKTA